MYLAAQQEIKLLVKRDRRARIEGGAILGCHDLSLLKLSAGVIFIVDIMIYL